MPIKVGDRIPSVKFRVITKDGPKELTSDDALGRGKVVLFALPGAYTPTCSAKHLPGFVGKADEIKHKGVDKIVCLSVNDGFVMNAWGKDQNVGDKVVMLPDGNAEFTKAVGLEMDGRGFGLGERSKRYAMVIDNGVIKHLAVENQGQFEVSSAEAVLKAL